eukprot:Skav230819  [mRNA]  locus=scaffold851:322732:324823:+ [translate_table: standard]
MKGDATCGGARARRPPASPPPQVNPPLALEDAIADVEVGRWSRLNALKGCARLKWSDDLLAALAGLGLGHLRWCIHQRSCGMPQQMWSRCARLKWSDDLPAASLQPASLARGVLGTPLVRPPATLEDAPADVKALLGE